VAVERQPANLNIDPDEMDRHIHTDTDIDAAAVAVSGAFPGLDPRPEKIIPCMVTDSADGQFIVGRLTTEPRVLVAGGDSGHGFKHAAGIGELLAQIALGERAYCEAAFMDPARFS
jgi:sarcosine oxidase